MKIIQKQKRGEFLGEGILLMYKELHEKNSGVRGPPPDRPQSSPPRALPRVAHVFFLNEA